MYTHSFNDEELICSDRSDCVPRSKLTDNSPGNNVPFKASVQFASTVMGSMIGPLLFNRADNILPEEDKRKNTFPFHDI